MSRRPALLGALIAVAVLLACHALGMREDVSVLSGTAPATGAESALLGVIYVLAWFAALVVAPILALGALFDYVLERKGPLKTSNVIAAPGVPPQAGR